MTDATHAAQAHEGLFTAAETFFAAEDVRVSRYPGPIAFGERIVTMGNVAAHQEVATSNRGRDEKILVDMAFTAHAGGDQDTADKAARDAAFDMLNRFADYVRRNVTELDGDVEWCFLTDHSTDSAPVKAGGITWEISATFESFYRVRG